MQARIIVTSSRIIKTESSSPDKNQPSVFSPLCLCHGCPIAVSSEQDRQRRLY